MMGNIGYHGSVVRSQQGPSLLAQGVREEACTIRPLARIIMLMGAPGLHLTRLFANMFNIHTITCVCSPCDFLVTPLRSSGDPHCDPLVTPSVNPCDPHCEPHGAVIKMLILAGGAEWCKTEAVVFMRIMLLALHVTSTSVALVSRLLPYR